MPAPISAQLTNLRKKLQIFSELGQFTLFESVLPVVDLSTFGFFTSPSSAIDQISAVAATPSLSFICPTDQIRRVIACSLTKQTGVTVTSQIGLIHPSVSGLIVLVAGLTEDTIIINRDFLWYPGSSLFFIQDYATTGSFDARIFFVQEDAGIAPTK